MQPAPAFFVGFILGFVTGRAGHVMYGGESGFHHWMLGIPIIVLGAVFKSLAVVGFGLGLCVSDLDDMLAGRLDEASPSDLKEKKEFWATD